MLNVRWPLVSAALIILGLGTVVTADETTLCNFYVRSVPYTITTQGHYCFDRNLSTAMTNGNAITIDADYVVLDLNHFKLGGGAAGEASEAYGIVVLDHRNVVVRNGIVRGFYVGISLFGISSVVENNILDGNLFAGILLGGTYNIARGNHVTSTGGSAVTTAWAAGILTCGGCDSYALITDNAITGVSLSAASSGGVVYGIAAEGQYESLARNSISALFQRAGISTFGIHAQYGAYCRDNTVILADVAYYNCAPVSGNYP